MATHPLKSFLYYTGCSFCIPDRSASEVNEIKQSLTVIPKSHPLFPSRKSIELFETSANGKWLRIPRAFAMERSVSECEIIAKFDERSAAKPQFPAFRGELKTHQIAAYEAVTSHLTAKSIGTVCLSTAFGKTYLALAIAHHFKRPVLILVHLSLLLEQWQKIVREMYPDAKVGIWQGNKARPDVDCDIVVGMIQTVVRLDVSKLKDAQQWLPGFVIIDECHIFGADIFSKLFYRVQAPLMLGLTATPERQDGLESILYAHLGPLCYQGAIHREEQTIVVKLIKTPYVFQAMTDTERVTKVATLEPRNELIIAKLTPFLEDRQRHILILCARCEQAEWFHRQLMRSSPDEVGLLLSRNRQDRANELSKRILCTTFQTFSTGVSKDSLNTLVFASPPKSRLVQALGRILRQHHGALSPTVLDIYDSDEKDYKLKERQRVYRQQSNQMVDFCYA